MKKQKNKFNNVIVFDGEEKFDSQKEYNRWRELCLLERARVINGLKRQIPFTLIEKSQYGREITYVADFCYWENGKYIVEDTKSEITKTPLYRLKKRLMAELHGIIILET